MNRSRSKDGKPQRGRTGKRSLTGGGKRQAIEFLGPWGSAVAYWAAQAPLAWTWLAWVAPLGWLHVAQRPQALTARSYWNLWFSGCAFWLATLQGIRLAYWPLYAGWIALSLYLAIYIPLFVFATRWLRERRVPLWAAAPVAWQGCDWIRGWMLSGYSANMLVHTQVSHPEWIQLADLVGGIGVSALIVLCSTLLYASLAAVFAGDYRRGTVLAVALVVVVGSMYAYGRWRLVEADQRYASGDVMLKAALVQENTPTMFEAGQEELQKAWTEYLKQTRKVAGRGPVELVVWPESTFSAGTPWIASEVPARLPPELTDAGLDRQTLQQWVSRSQQDMKFKAQLVLAAARGQELYQADADVGQWPWLLVGADAMEIGQDRLRRYNAALLIDPQAQVADHYYKMHLVMFGEYIPLPGVLGWLGGLFGFSGIDAGSTPACFEVAGVHLAPNICFESMMPQLVRRQLVRLSRQGHQVQCLVNLTNDSWFRGSSMLDHHLACSVVTAVESRCPMLVAANTGLSAEIDGAGRVLQKLDRFESGVLFAEPRPDGRFSMVRMAGYPLAALSGLVVLLALVYTATMRMRSVMARRSAVG